MVIKTKKVVSKYDMFFALEADSTAKGTKIKKATIDDTVTDYTEENDNTEVKDDETKTTDYTDEANTQPSNTNIEANNNGDENNDTEGTDYTENPEDGSEDQSTSLDDSEGTDYTENPENPEDGTTPTDDNAEEEDSNEDIQTQKYNLYREYMRLYTAMKRYINKLENTVKDDIDGNMVIISVTKKLREIQDLIYEYLTVKFHSTEYAESLLYFHTCIETIGLTFKLLKNNEIFIKQ